MPLHPRLPVWMARALLGSPLSLEDLNEFDPALYQRACLVTRHPNVEALNLPFLEEITRPARALHRGIHPNGTCESLSEPGCRRYGVTRSFPSPLGPRVTASNQQLYGLWLKEVHLHLATEAHVRQMQRGFVGAIQGCPLPKPLQMVPASGQVPRGLHEHPGLVIDILPLLSMPHFAFGLLFLTPPSLLMMRFRCQTTREGRGRLIRTF